jgi:hypothetical protein
MKNPVLIFYSGADRVSFESLAVRVNDSFCSLPICLPVMFESLAVRVNDSFCSLLILFACGSSCCPISLCSLGPVSLAASGVFPFSCCVFFIPDLGLPGALPLHCHFGPTARVFVAQLASVLSHWRSVSVSGRIEASLVSC